jgi:hypothetical protein
MRPGRTGPRLPAAAIAAALSLSGTAPCASPPDAGWGGTLDEARRKALADGKPVLLYFPPVRAADAPPPLLDAASLRKVGDRFHLARARAADLQDLRGLLDLKKVPALFLLDRRGNMVERWGEDGIPSDVWTQVERAARRLRAAEEEMEAALAAARAAFARENFAAALSAVSRVRAAARPGYPEPAAAAELESAVLSRAAVEMRKVMARDGLAPDAAVLADLGRLKAAFPATAVVDAIAREEARIRTRNVGGKKDARGNPQEKAGKP